MKWKKGLPEEPHVLETPDVYWPFLVVCKGNQTTFNITHVIVLL